MSADFTGIKTVAVVSAGISMRSLSLAAFLFQAETVFQRRLSASFGPRQITGGLRSDDALGARMLLRSWRETSAVPAWFSWIIGASTPPRSGRALLGRCANLWGPFFLFFRFPFCGRLPPSRMLSIPHPAFRARSSAIAHYDPPSAAPPGPRTIAATGAIARQLHPSRQQARARRRRCARSGIGPGEIG